MLGVVRLHLDDDRKGGEYAVIVRSALKGHGLGWLLMQRMIEYARMIGLKRVHGQVLAENTTMLRMCAHLGFHISDDPHAKDIKVVTLELGGQRPSIVRRGRLGPLRMTAHSARPLPGDPSSDRPAWSSRRSCFHCRSRTC